MREAAMPGSREDGTARKLVRSYKVFCVAFAAFLALAPVADIVEVMSGAQADCDVLACGFQNGHLDGGAISGVGLTARNGRSDGDPDFHAALVDPFEPESFRVEQGCCTQNAGGQE